MAQKANTQNFWPHNLAPIPTILLDHINGYKSKPTAVIPSVENLLALQNDMKSLAAAAAAQVKAYERDTAALTQKYSFRNKPAVKDKLKVKHVPGNIDDCTDM